MRKFKWIKWISLFPCLAAIVLAVSISEASSTRQTTGPTGKVIIDGVLGSDGITVYLTNNTNPNYGMFSSASSLPADGKRAVAKGAVLLMPNIGTKTSGFYHNIGTALYSQFVPLGTYHVERDLPTCGGTATTTIYTVAPESCKLSDIKFVFSGTLSASNSDFFTFTFTNVHQLGTTTGSTELGTSTTNSTKPTSVGTITAMKPYTMVLAGTATSLYMTRGDVIKVEVVGSSSTALTTPTLLLTYGR